MIQRFDSCIFSTITNLKCINKYTIEYKKKNNYKYKIALTSNVDVKTRSTK